MDALFIYDTDDLDSSVSGGVQICSREFLAIVRAASASTTVLDVQRSRSPWLRLRRKLRLGSYLGYEPENYAASIRAVLGSAAISHVFLNQTALVRFAPFIKSWAPKTQIVLMSHGNQSGDDLYEAASPYGRRSRGIFRFAYVWQLGLDLVSESRHRRECVDAVCVMSDEEAVLEKWLGASRVLVLPRTLNPDVLNWEPVPGRIGYVGTLDHTPNRIAFEGVCREIAKRNIPGCEIRLVGRPPQVGTELSARYPFVRYLGPLDDSALRAEASTWNVFMNPIFWLSRGASMKLGVALGWGLPVVSTLSGARGYELGDSGLPTVADDPTRFAAEIERLMGDAAAMAQARASTLRALAATPSTAQLSERLREFLR